MQQYVDKVKNVLWKNDNNTLNHPFWNELILCKNQLKNASKFKINIFVLL